MRGPERLWDSGGRAEARTLLASAATAGNPRERLAASARELERLAAAAQSPVRLRLESDGLTQVVIYRVGQYGTFSDARRGAVAGALYGRRHADRVPRRAARSGAAAGRRAAAVVVRCEEPFEGILARGTARRAASSCRPSCRSPSAGPARGRHTGLQAGRDSRARCAHDPGTCRHAGAGRGYRRARRGPHRARGTERPRDDRRASCRRRERHAPAAIRGPRGGSADRRGPVADRSWTTSRAPRTSSRPPARGTGRDPRAGARLAAVGRSRSAISSRRRCRGRRRTRRPTSIASTSPARPGTSASAGVPRAARPVRAAVEAEGYSPARQAVEVGADRGSNSWSRSSACRDASPSTRAASRRRSRWTARRSVSCRASSSSRPARASFSIARRAIAEERIRLEVAGGGERQELKVTLKTV